MARKITQKELKHDEFVEAAFDFGHWLEENWRSVLLWVGLGMVLVLAVFGWAAWTRHARSEARQRLADAIATYDRAEAGGFAETASLTPALETFEAVASDMGGKPAGRLARFYRGASLYHLGRLEEARESLARVVGDTEASETVGATARVMLARLELAAGRESEALALLNALADRADAAVPPAQTLLEIGRIHERAGRTDEARAHWQRIVDEHPQSLSAAEARSLLQ